jgi:hypothetical protein
MLPFALGRSRAMSVDPRGFDHSTLRNQTDEAFEIAEPVQNPRIASRTIAVIVAILIGLALLAVLFWQPF